jgi:chaperone BCS1
MTDDRLQHLCNNVPARSFLLLEDIDASVVYNRHNGSEGTSVRKLTLSGLLNAIDGVAASEERIIFMTTNHRDRLDSALIRPGRIDVQMELGLSDPYQAEKMFVRFYPESGTSMARSFAGYIGDKKMSPAEIQDVFISFPTDPQRALDFVRNRFQTI